MKLDEFKQKAGLVRDNERYRIYDFKMERIVVSLTELKSHQETKGHKHQGIEEVYYFIEGKGKMKIGEKIIQIDKGDIVTIPDGKFHKVYNLNNEILKFLSIFEKYDRK